MSHSSKILLLIIFLTSFKSFALTASVQDVKGKLLEGVEITFANDDTTLFTNAAGSFDYLKEVPIYNGIKIIEQIKLSFNGNYLQFSIPEKANVSISMFNLRGQEIISHKAIMSQGVKNIDVPQLSNGFYIMHIKVGDQKFTKKFIFTTGLSWTSVLSKKETSISQQGSRASIVDTVFFNITGYNQESRAITSYAQDLGKVVLVDGIYPDNWYGLEAFDVDTVLPNFVNILFRAYDQNGYGIPNIDTSRFIALEDDEPMTSESEFTIERASAFADTIKTVMLLDHSKSVEANLDQIKEAAKVMVRNIAPSQQIAIYAFSENAVKVVDFTHDTTELLTGIDKIPLGYSSTNLYGALLEAFTLIRNYANVITKTIMYGNVVLFTDGKDTQGSNTLQQVLSSQGDKQVFSLGLGTELDTTALRQISGEFLFTTTDVNELAALFGDIQEKISMMANSYYWAHYRSPKRGYQDHTIKLNVTGNSNGAPDATISGTFNSALFTAGLAPTADSLDIILNETEDTLIGFYIYNDSEGEEEGESNYIWKINGSVVDTVSNRIPYSLVNEGDTVLFMVQPVSLFGSPNTGSWVYSKTTISIPKITNLSMSINTSKDSLSASYNFVDIEPEGESIIEWYLGDSLIYTGESLPVSTIEKKAETIFSSQISIVITPISNSGIPKKGISVSLIKELGDFFHAPFVDSMSYKLNDTKDTLVGTYKYIDTVNLEGNSIIEWYLNDTIKVGDGLTLPVAILNDIDSITSFTILSFKIIPVSNTGVLKTGTAKYFRSTIGNYFHAPSVSNLKVQSSDYQDTIFGTYDFSDIDSPEGESIYNWYLNDVALGDQNDTIFLDTSLLKYGYNKIVFSVTPKSITGVLLMGNAVSDTSLIYRYKVPKMKYVYAKDSSFSLGQINIAEPVHSVQFTYDFYIDSTEITQLEYNSIMSHRIFGYANYQNSFLNDTYPIGDNYPAYNTNWYDAVLYCNARSKAGGLDTVYSYSSISGRPGNNCIINDIIIDFTKNGYRLPTEAEWEYSCRAGTGSDYYWGDNNINEYAWFSSNTSKKVQEVAGLLPNEYGLYDMSGNVSEWCNDIYREYPDSLEIDPIGPDLGIVVGRVFRGGSILSSNTPLTLRSASRRYSNPDIEALDKGFRCALTAK